MRNWSACQFWCAPSCTRLARKVQSKAQPVCGHEAVGTVQVHADGSGFLVEMREGYKRGASQC